MNKNHSRGILGHTHSPETNLKMIKARLGEKNPNFEKYKILFIFF